MLLLLGNEEQHYPPLLIPLKFSSVVLYTQGSNRAEQLIPFKNEGASKDAFKYHTAERQDLCVRCLPSFHIKVPSLACGPHACTCYPHSQQNKTSETPDPNMPRSSLANAIVTETHLHLYFPPFISNQMQTGNNLSDMNLIRG